MKCLPREMIVESITAPGNSTMYMGPGSTGIDDKWRFVTLSSPIARGDNGEPDWNAPRAHITLPVLAKNLSKYPQVGETTSVEIFLR